MVKNAHVILKYEDMSLNAAKMRETLATHQITYRQIKIFYNTEGKKTGIATVVFEEEPSQELIDTLFAPLIPTHFLSYSKASKDDVEELFPKKIRPSYHLDILAKWPTVSCFYLVDFEVSTKHFPVEMAMIKVDKQTMQIVGKLHVMIGCQLEAEDMKDANYTTRRIHGIPFASMVGANYDHKAVAQSMLTFIGLESLEQWYTCLVLAKDPALENKCIAFLNGLEPTASMPASTTTTTTTAVVTPSPWVYDVADLVIGYTGLQFEDTPPIVRGIHSFLEDEDRCEFHSKLDSKFHCALQDCCAIAGFLKSHYQTDKFDFGIRQQQHISVEELIAQEPITLEEPTNEHKATWSQGAPDDEFF